MINSKSGFLETLQERSWVRQGIFLTKLTLPFVSLYKPASMPLSYGLGTLSIIQGIKGFVWGKSDTRQENAFILAKGVADLAATYFQPRSMIVASSVFELIQSAHNLYQAPWQEKTPHLGECLSTTVSFICVIQQNSLQWLAFSLTIRALSNFYQAYQSYQAEKKPENVAYEKPLTVVAKIAMGVIYLHQTNQILVQLRQLQALQNFLARIKEAAASEQTLHANRCSGQIEGETENTRLAEIKSSLSPEKVITDGYGEYIITYPKPEDKELNEKVYEQCYLALIELKKQSLKGEKKMTEREVVAQIDPSLRLTFVPRVLYEMFYMEQCIKECLAKDKKWLQNLYAMAVNLRPFPKELEKSWFGPFVGSHGDDYHPKIIKTAYRLNQVIATELKPDQTGNLIYGEITRIAREKIAFLHQVNIYSKSELSEKVKEVAIAETLLANLLESGINTDTHREILLNTVALECSSIAKNARILYRGGDLSKDSPILSHQAKLLSFGSGIYAGNLWDPEACAFYHISVYFKEAYAIIIPNEEVRTSPFSVPTTHPLCQMNGFGERFHARTKAWILGVNPNSSTRPLGGSHHAYSTVIRELPSDMRIDLTEEQFMEKYQAFLKRGLVVLQRSNQIGDEVGTEAELKAK
jgi:hypothetical protein